MFFIDIPNWIGGSLPILNSHNENLKNATDKENTSEHIENRNQENATGTSKHESSTQLNPHNIALEIQNSYSSLHQQESFLLFSLQLKKYEETLTEIKDQQKVISDKQQDQFKHLIDDYILKQKITENNIKLQQDRINNQMQMILSDSFSQLKPEQRINSKEGPEEFESPIQNLKQRHNEELFILEESYK